MPDDTFTEFLIDLITNENDLLHNYLHDPKGVVAKADLTDDVRKAFAALPTENALRFQIQNTQGKGPKKKAVKKAKKAAVKKPKPAAKKAVKGGKKR